VSEIGWYGARFFWYKFGLLFVSFLRQNPPIYRRYGTKFKTLLFTNTLSYCRGWSQTNMNSKLCLIYVLSSYRETKAPLSRKTCFSIVKENFDVIYSLHPIQVVKTFLCECPKNIVNVSLLSKENDFLFTILE